MTLQITGHTFPHRETLKELGARWNGEYKRWEVGRLPPSQLALVKSWPGVMVVDSEPQPSQSPPLTIDGQTERLLDADRRRGYQPPKSVGKTTLFGDDQTYLNYFAEKNPISFFGFSSLNALVDYVQSLPPSKQNGVGWETDAERHVFTATKDMDAAIKLARDGWPEGLGIAEEISQKLKGLNALERRRKHSVAGGSVNVGRMLSGNPLHMYSRPKQPGRKIIKLFVEAGTSGVITAKNSIIRAGIIAAIAEILEMNGYSCEIVITHISQWRDKPCVQRATTVKSVGEPLDLNDLVFALGHPSFARRFMFACVGSDDRLEPIWSTMGIPGVVFDDDNPTQKNELFIDRIYPTNQSLIDSDAPLLTKAMQIWDLIVSDDLPITLNREDTE